MGWLCAEKYNLEFLPDTLNKRKGDKVGDRQVQLARKWARAGVLSKEGLEKVEGAFKKSK